jgi:hypothetical protein
MVKPRTAFLAALAIAGALAGAFAQTGGDNAPAATSPTAPTGPSDMQAPNPPASPDADQSPVVPAPKAPDQNAPSASEGPPATTAAAPPPPVPSAPLPTPANAVLIMTGLDKITGRPTRIYAPLNVPVEFATFTITARTCYSTPSSETPETSAFVQVDDHRPDQPPRRVFSGWMYASSPGLNGVEHPLYDVWVISCRTKAPGQPVEPVASSAPVKVRSPDVTDSEGLAPLPEGSGQ